MALGASPVERITEEVRRAEFRREEGVTVQKQDLVTLLAWAQSVAPLLLADDHSDPEKYALHEEWKKISGT